MRKSISESAALSPVIYALVPAEAVVPRLAAEALGHGAVVCVFVSFRLPARRRLVIM